MGKPLKGQFLPKNPNKYIGTYPITYRSSWEQTFINVCDETPSIIHWASESISIPYINPLKPPNKQWSMYIPDFFLIYIDKNSQKHAEIIEIKPLRETPGFNEGRLTERTKLTQVINQAKWHAAQMYCRTRGWSFRIMTERELFGKKK